MPRKPRFYLSDVPVHIVQRGHSRGPVFYDAQDYATYAYWLKEASNRYDVAIHAFNLRGLTPLIFHMYYQRHMSEIVSLGMMAWVYSFGIGTKTSI